MARAKLRTSSKSRAWKASASCCKTSSALKTRRSRSGRGCCASSTPPAFELPSEKQMSDDVLVVAPIHEDALQLIRDAGLGVTDARGKPPTEVRELLKTHRALLGRAGVKIDDDLLAEAKHLRIVAVGSVGMDSLDLPYLYSRGLKVFNAAGGNRNAVAELAIGNAIALLRQTHKANADLHKGIWPAMFERPPGNELYGKTVGIVGLGDIGSLLARLFLAFETTVIAHDPYVRYVYDASLHQTRVVELVKLDELLRRADLITVHVPLSDETF